LIPCLLGAITLTADLVAGKPLAANNEVWLRLLIGFDIIYTALSLALVDTVLVG
jgi:heme exporter protein B